MGITADVTIGSEITIPGSNFGTKKGKILIGKFATKISSWTNSSITCAVNKVPFPVGFYDMTIQRQPLKTVPPVRLIGAFTVKNPEIDPLQPNSSSSGAEITATGKFFSTKKGKVYLEDLVSGKKKNCKVTYWYMDPATGASEFTFVVPKLSKSFLEGTYRLKVTNKVGTAQTPFTVGH
jgi:hypothetical protein